MIRIDKFLSDQNIGTRKEIGIFIRKGRVSVDDVVVKNSSQKIDETTAKICFDGREISYAKFIYIMMNKPKGILSATRDSKARTVLDIVPENLQRKNLFPAGRLDKDTTGLLLITDDGEFAHKMLAPKSHVFKLYKASLDIELEESDIEKFASGIKSGENEFLPAVLEIDKENPFIGFVKIREGKFHQVKRMFKACGKTVVDLERLSIGKLELDQSLQQGECKELSKSQAEEIFL